ncbi:Zinc finger RING-type domain-containing protein [Penicillium ucsense]|uniref:RING-type E3 ubiquitin transferase n=1 Tax=Penicillium ucsense TaxID=2839758 RepID=A0A8J8W4C0_9EURO|nr:Zinc finger RING-type domain-containing protein [Penicillium ucsense]KAF7739280.1 Zinc finger RING-type domain-containing protein [Penicillium ucsense]
MADSGDRGMCHACGGVWLLNRGDSAGPESHLTCPHCDSDFIEIIEIPPESPQPEAEADPRSPPVNPWADHNPWAQEEPGSGIPGVSFQSYRSPDGRFSFSTTMIGGGIPSQQGAQPNPMLPMVMQNLETLFQGLTGMHNGRQAQQSPGMAMPPPQAHMAGSQGQETGNRDPSHVQGDSDGPHEGQPFNGPGITPVTIRLQSIADLFNIIQGDIPMQQNAAGQAAGDASRLSPFAMLSALMNVQRSGDAVYSQEELDRVISQLIDHAQQGNGPPPAPESIINSLPKKKVTPEMVGTDGKADCSICMESVELNTEVTVLPCDHWFHFDCIKLWLSQHNTCPHCRRSIGSPNTTNSAQGTQEDPFVIPDSPVQSSQQIPPQHSFFSSFPNNQATDGTQSSTSAHTHAAPAPETEQPGFRQESQSETNPGSGGITGWVWNRLGGGGNS